MATLIREGYPMYCAHFPGGDPRRFEPDEEGVTPEELEAWRQACEAAEGGERYHQSAVFAAKDGDVTIIGHKRLFGPGVYWYEKDYFEEDEAES